MTTDVLIDAEFHAIIPPLAPEEFRALEESIISEGCRDAIVVWKQKGVIVDGHNRYDICTKHGISYRVFEKSFADRDKAILWLIDNQFGRRNINLYQRSVLVLKREEVVIRARARAKQQEHGRTAPGRRKSLSQNSVEVIDTQEELAKVAKVSHDTIWKVKQIEGKATPEQKLQLVKSERTINQVYVAIRRNENKERLKETEWPVGKYRVIYADPPWEYSNNQPAYFGEQADHYALMDIEQICNLPVGNISLDDSVLFLWSTSAILEDAFRVINAWGFKYKASFVWDKVKHVMGHYNSVRHELLLIGVKGSCQPDQLQLYDSVQSIERTDEHSQKPARFREIIETLYPYGPRIELFGRQKAEGWDFYGNKTDAEV